MLPVALEIGTGLSGYRNIGFPANSLRHAIELAAREVRKRSYNINSILGGLWLYIGSQYYSNLRNCCILRLSFPEDWVEVKAWCTSPEMCGVDVKVKKQITHPQLYHYVSVLKNWRWDISSPSEEYIGKYAAGIRSFKSQYSDMYNIDRSQLGLSTIPVNIKDLNLFTKNMPLNNTGTLKECM